MTAKNIADKHHRMRIALTSRKFKNLALVSCPNAEPAALL